MRRVAGSILSRDKVCLFGFISFPVTHENRTAHLLLFDFFAVTIRYTTDLLTSCCGIDSNMVYILPPFAIWQSRAVNTNVPYLDKNSDFGLSNMFLVFSITSAGILRVIKRKPD